MKREQFFDVLGEHDCLIAFVHNNDEVLAKFDLNVVSVNEYDDEIVIWGDGTSFIVLQGDPEEGHNLPGETEYVFKNGNYKVGIVF